MANRLQNSRTLQSRIQNCCLGSVVGLIGTADILVGMLKITIIYACLMTVGSTDTRIQIAFFLLAVMGMIVYAYQAFIGAMLCIAMLGDPARRHGRCKIWHNGSVNLLKVLVLEFFIGFLPLTMFLTLDNVIPFAIYMITKLVLRTVACTLVKLYMELLTTTSSTNCGQYDRTTLQLTSRPLPPTLGIRALLPPSEDESPPPAYDDLFSTNAEAHRDNEA